MMIRTESYSEYINSAEIARLRTDHKGEPFAVLRDGTVVRLSKSDSIDDVVAQATPIVPATAGYEALWIVRYGDDEPLGVIRHPVLGWRASEFGGMLPVTFENESLSSNIEFSGVKYPDGRVVVPAETTYDTEEAWLKDMQEEETRRRAQKPAA